MWIDYIDRKGKWSSFPVVSVVCGVSRLSELALRSLHSAFSVNDPLSGLLAAICLEIQISPTANLSSSVATLLENGILS